MDGMNIREYKDTCTAYSRALKTRYPKIQVRRNSNELSQCLLDYRVRGEEYGLREIVVNVDWTVKCRVWNI
jgi:hypothetical protein